jgi:hypothetical protein
MAYNTPELFLVGAAQNLVLGVLAKAPNRNCDFLQDDYTEAGGRPESNSW